LGSDAPPRGSIDTDIRPSTAPDRIEVVSLNAEIPGHGYLAMHEIQRDKDGKFFSLGEDQGGGAADMQGRFAGILPATQPTDIEAEVVRKVLRSFGINPDGTRINPLWNSARRSCLPSPVPPKVDSPHFPGRRKRGIGSNQVPIYVNGGLG